MVGVYTVRMSYKTDRCKVLGSIGGLVHPTRRRSPEGTNPILSPLKVHRFILLTSFTMSIYYRLGEILQTGGLRVDTVKAKMSDKRVFSEDDGLAAVKACSAPGPMPTHAWSLIFWTKKWELKRVYAIFFYLAASA